MSIDPPEVKTPTQSEMLRELTLRMRTFVPTWQPKDGVADFGQAALKVAARLEAEVTERLKQTPAKNFGGFLDWLGVVGQASRASRLHVFFKMDAAAAPLLASAPVRLQASIGGATVPLETVKELQIVPGRIETIVGADPDSDRFVLPPPAPLRTSAAASLPTRWQVKSVAASRNKLQLTPELGLGEGVFLKLGASEHRVIAVDKDVVTIDPAYESAEWLARADAVTVYEPFEKAAGNRQEHSLYIGDDDALNIKAASTISIDGAGALGEGTTWHYWGKKGETKEADWHELVPSVVGGALQLAKADEGAIEPREIGGLTSRWLRGQRKPGVDSATTLSHLQLRASSARECDPNKLDIATGAASKVEIEGFANTTPLVMNGEFFPFGRQPKQFDAFYLGSREAFSKRDAKVTVSIGVANATMGPMAGIVCEDKRFVFGIGADGVLYRAIVADGVDPKFLDLPEVERATFDPTAPRGDRLVLNSTHGMRPVAFECLGKLHVLVAAGRDVLQWSTNTSDGVGLGQWIRLATVEAEDTASEIESLIVVREAVTEFRWLAACEGKVFKGKAIDAGGVAQFVSDDARRIIRLANILKRDHSIEVEPNALLAFDDAGSVLRPSTDGTKWEPATTATAVIHAGCSPTAVQHPSKPKDFIAFLPAKIDERLKLVALTKGRRTLAPDNAATYSLAGHAVDFASRKDDAGNAIIVAVLTARDEQASRIAIWDPLSDVGVEPLEPVPTAGRLSEAPTIIDRTDSEAPRLIAVPGSARDVLSTTFGGNRLVLKGTVSDGLYAADAMKAAFVGIGDKVTVREGTPIDLGDRGAVVPLTSNLTSLEERVALYEHGQTGKGLGKPGATTLTVESDAPRKGDFIVLGPSDDLTILRVEKREGNLCTLNGALPGVSPSVPRRGRGRTQTDPSNGDVEFEFVVLKEIPDVIPRPLLTFEAAVGDLVEKLTDYGVHFNLAPVPEPSHQRVLGVEGKVAVLTSWWRKRPSDSVEVVLDDALGQWRRSAADAARNPELSWEYWNGRSWRVIDKVADGTGNLLISNQVAFDVPSDIEQTDVVGAENYWIRARLVGGDYGQETVTIVPTNPAGGQKVDRDPSTIRPPKILNIEVCYAGKYRDPKYVQTKDNGAFRDQSSASRLPGGIVEAFVPLKTFVARLSSKTPPATSPAQSCGCVAKPCLCEEPNAAPDTARGGAGSSDATDVGRCLFVAITPSGKPVTNGQIRLLFDVEPGQDAGAMDVAAFRNGMFEKLSVVDDETRSLSETGLVSFNVPGFEQVELFGVSAYWLRLAPPKGTKAWSPRIRGAFLNGAPVAAQDSQEMEVLGSSSGAPRQVFVLARRPVIHESLRLWVREALSEEERASLRQRDITVNDQFGFDGIWVLWRQVDDTGDHDASARVYSLEPEKGVVRFGDGVHGMVPPSGRDNVVAGAYQRAGGAVANELKPWTTLTLATALAGVDEAIAPGTAAGGTNADSVAQIKQWAPGRLRHRDRAITPRDLEQLACTFSRQVSQARCVTSAPCRLVVVGAADSIEPKPQTLRELRRYLSERASPVLTRGGFSVEAVKRVPICLKVYVCVNDNDNIGAVGRDATKAIKTLFDPVVGGADKTGWRLGATPTDVDVAAVLEDLKNVDFVRDVKIFRVKPATGNRPVEIGSDEIAGLDDDGIAFEFDCGAGEAAA